MNLPMDIRKLRLLGKTFTLHLVGEGHEEVKDDFIGRSDTDGQQLFVRDGLPPETEQDTVLHELLHIISDMLELGMDERQVACAATALLAVLKDNPKLAAYLTRGET